MLAIAGGKGGCGKTTTALGLAAALARRGRTPLVVDADVGMPDLHRRAGVDPTPDLTDVAAGRPASRVARALPSRPGVEVIPAGEAGAVREALARLAGHPDPVLVDCPSGAGPDAARPLRAADEALVVSTGTRPSLRDAAKTAAMARELEARPVGALLTRVDRADGGPSVAAERRLPCPVLGRAPAVEDALADPDVRAVHDEVTGQLPTGR